MEEKPDQSGELAEMRRNAERLAALRELKSLTNISSLSPEEIQHTLHELRVHQIELEMQNDELRRIQDELAASRARYFDLYDLAPVGYLSIKENGLILEGNLAVAALLGVDRSQLVMHRFSRFVLPEDQDAYYLHHKQLLETGIPQVCEMRLIKRNASPFWARMESSVVRDVDGAPLFRSVVSDAPERQREETALREQKQVLADILETTLAGYWDWNIAEHTAYLSPAFKKMFGYDDDELRNSPETWQRLLFPVDLASELDAFHSHVFSRSNERYCREIRFRHKDGSTVWVIRSGRVIKWAEDGSPLRMVGCHVDITERKRAEQERERMQIELAQAQKMEAIGTLAGGIAHDFNNVLGGILGGLSLLELEVEDSRLQPDIREMKQLIERAANLTKALLGYARRGKYDVKPLNLALTVEKTCEMFGRTRKDIIIQQEFAPGLLAVLMDHTQLEQVLLNLFINAGQAMPEGGKLMLDMQNVELDGKAVAGFDASPGRFVRLTVADTGVGMDFATQTRIFEPFFTTKDVGRGTGLGLASVYGIVKSHHGLIHVESELGKGTTFTLHLPATEVEPVTEYASVPSDSVRPGKGTILVVDDEEPVLRICAREVRHLGYRVLTASGGRQALDIIRQRGAEISLVILDMTMPDMSGSDTYDELQKIAPDMKVLLCSGYSVNGQAQGILARGCNGFIQKPFDIATLSSRIQDIL